MTRCVDIQPYHPGDARLLSFRMGDEYVPLDIFERQCEFAHECLTVSVDGEPVLIVGSNILWPGTAEMWAVVADSARGHGRTIMKFLKRYRPVYMRRNDIRRVQVTVHAEKPEYRKFIEKLGFQQESIMMGAAPDGGDLVMYVDRRKTDGVERQERTTA